MRPARACYGDLWGREVDERFGPLIPVSTYGASKLAGEAMLAAYSHMFGIDTVVFRFANVVGPNQTHGVTFDFVRHLLEDPTRLPILGDGSQSKSYIHVSDVVAAMLTLTDRGWDRVSTCSTRGLAITSRLARSPISSSSGSVSRTSVTSTPVGRADGKAMCRRSLPQ